MVLSWVILLAGLLGFVTSASALEDVNLQAPGSSSVNSLIYRIGQERGFYKDNGLNVLAIQASSQAGIQGLVGGSFHFSGTSGVGTAAALRGAPLKNVMVFETRPLFWLYANKKIKSVQDLKGGKVVGISSLGANTDLITREVLLANRIDPRRDVVIQASEQARFGYRRCSAVVSMRRSSILWKVSSPKRPASTKFFSMETMIWESFREE